MLAIRTNDKLKYLSLSKDINCEYIAINHISIFGFKIEILNP